MKLLMLKGLPASGKSTYAKELADKDWVRVNKDDLRAMMNNSKWSKGNEKRVLKIRDQIISEALADGKNVVVDDTNFAPYHKNNLKQLAERYNAQFEEKFFDTPLQVCLNRDAKRANGVGKDVIMKMYNQFLKPKPPVYVPPKNGVDAIMVDIDGTLAHMKDRSPFEWHRVGEDDVDEAIAELISILSDRGYKIIMMSGRDSVCRVETGTWLKEHGIPYDKLYMRAEKDMRKDNVVKLELFKEHVEPVFNIKFVLDDRNQVVDMWRNELGLKVLQVAEGDF